MRIGELARIAGVSERALRYYEEQGLLSPSRRSNGYRDYGDDDLRDVHRIRLMLSAGLGSTVIAEVLPCLRSGRTKARPVCAELRAGLRRERDRIDSAVGELQAAAAILDTLISAPQGLRGGL